MFGGCAACVPIYTHAVSVAETTDTVGLTFVCTWTAYERRGTYLSRTPIRDVSFKLEDGRKKRPDHPPLLFRSALLYSPAIRAYVLCLSLLHDEVRASVQRGVQPAREAEDVEEQEFGSVLGIAVCSAAGRFR